MRRFSYNASLLLRGTTQLPRAAIYLALLIGLLLSYSQAISVDLGSNARGIVMDTRSGALFISTDNTEIWSVENSDYVHKLTQLAGSGAANLAMVDFLHQDLGWMYGLLAATKLSHVVHYVSLTAGASPPAQANLFAGVAGVSGSSGSVDGVGGAARLNEPSWLAAAHTAPRWFVSTPPARSIRGLEFPCGVGVQLSVSTVFTHATLTIDAVGISADDSVLYFYESAGSGDLFKLSDPLTTVGATSAVLIATSVAHAYQMFVHPTADILLVADGSSDAYVVSTATGLIQSTVATSGLSRAAFVHPNGTELYGMAGATDNLHTHCCQTAYDESFNWVTASTQPVANSPPQVYDIQFDARSSTVFYSTDTEVRTMYGSAIASSISTGVHFAMVDTIVCGFGRVYGVMSTSQDHAVRFVALSPGPPPTPSGSPQVVAGQSSVSGTSDGIGSAALFNSPSFIAGAHTVARWVIGGNLGNGVRCANFVGSTPQLALNVSTIAGTETRQATGVALTADDRILYFVDAASNSLFYVTGPLTASPTLSSAVATYGTAPQQLLLDASGKYLVVGVAGDVLFTSSLTTAFKVQRFGTAAVALPNGTVLTGSPSMNMRKWCCLPDYGNSTDHAVALRVSFNLARVLAHDTRSVGLFSVHVSGAIQYLSLDPFSSTVVYNVGTMLFIAMADFIHCSGPIYGILMALQYDHKMSFLPLTPAAVGVPPVAGSTIDIAGDGTDADVDGVGSAARLGSLGYVTAAHTAPAWLVTGLFGERIRRVAFTDDVPLRLNVTTLITTPGKQTFGVVTTDDDSILYASVYNLQQIVIVLNPLSINPILGPALSISADHMHTVSLHPGCESLLLVGCQGEYLLVYNITSQSTIQSIRALDSNSPSGNFTLAGTVLANGTVIFAGYASSLDALASWCCLPSYSSSMRATYAPPVAPTPLALSSDYFRDVIHDTQSGGLFTVNSGDNIRYLSLNPLTSANVFYTGSYKLYVAMVDFVHCSGPIYGILISYHDAFKISFLPLTPAAPGGPPVAGTAIDVAGDGTSGNVDGVGSAARVRELGHVACAHTAPTWIFGGWVTESIRRASFATDFRLNVTTLIATPGKQPFGVVTTNDDTILYASVYNLQQIVIVLNPLSPSCSLGATLSIVANGMHKITLHPGCETLLLVGCTGDALLLYNIASQSVVRSLTAVASAPYTLASTILTNGTVLFASYSPSPLVSWCCLPRYDSSTLPAYSRFTPAITLPGSSSYTQDIVHDTKSGGLFSSHNGTGIQYVTLSPFSSTVVYSFTQSGIFIAMVDFIHCSGPIYGILVGFSSAHKITFLPLTPGAPPTPASTTIDVAGDGTSGNADGIGSAALFAGLGYIAAAHTAPVWIVGCLDSESIRLAVFTSDLPLRLNVTTLIATPGKQPNGVVMTNDDSILYATAFNFQQILTVLNPLSASPSLGPVLSIVRR